MNKEKQIIAIAEECGYVLKHCKYHKTTSWHTEGGFCMEEHSLPDYLNDLNAMHDAEEMITTDQQVDYVTELGFKYFDPETKVFRLARATAAERAEAFLKTINKWEEEG